MDQTPMSRRALIGGVSVATLALTMPSATAAATVPDTSFPAEWHALIADYRRRSADVTAAMARYNAAEDTYYAQRKPEPARESRPSPINEDMTIAQIKAVPLEAFERSPGAEWQSWKDEKDAAHARIVLPAEDALAAAWNHAHAAMLAVQSYPSVSPAMLTEKICLMAEYAGGGLGSEPDDLLGILADARRLSGREG